MKERKKYESKKIKRFLAVLVIVLSLFSVTAQGGDEDIQSKIERLTGAGRLHELLPESIYENDFILPDVPEQITEILKLCAHTAVEEGIMRNV